MGRCRCQVKIVEDVIENLFEYAKDCDTQDAERFSVFKGGLEQVIEGLIEQYEVPPINRE